MQKLLCVNTDVYDNVYKVIEDTEKKKIEYIIIDRIYNSIAYKCYEKSKEK